MKKKRRRRPGGYLGAVVSTGLALGLPLACGGDGMAFPAPPVEILSSPEAIGSGRRLYDRNCAICHGPGGHGDGPQARSLRPAPSDLRNLSGARAEAGYWFFRVKEGGKQPPLHRAGSAMPAWGDHLTDEEIWRVVAYLKSMIEDRT